MIEEDHDASPFSTYELEPNWYLSEYHHNILGKELEIHAFSKRTYSKVVLRISH